MIDLLRLPWLPPPPEDFRAQVRSLPSDGRAVQALAGYRLSLNQLSALGDAIQRARLFQADGALSKFRLGVISTATTEHLVPAMIASAARHGIALDVAPAPFGQLEQALLGEVADLFATPLDAVLVSMYHRGLANGDDATNRVAELCDSIHERAGCPCIIQTIPRPTERLLGSIDRTIPGTDSQLVDTVNRSILRRVTDTEDVLFDVAALAEEVGLSRWHDLPQWYVAKLPFSQLAVPLYTDALGRLLAALRGKSRRCLVLDLDNTLWGGVVGDDGLQGIRLGQGDPVGEAHLDIQRFALQLRERGIVLAVASKNEDDTARAPFRNHPDMLLREQHFAVFQANWLDKASNLAAIADTLALGLESFVLLDDNPAERAQVRRALPQVAIPELPDDAALFVPTVVAAGYFETTAVSSEDRDRAAYYEANAKRVDVRRRVSDLGAYLDSLRMTIEFAPFDELGRKRIVQLVNKSNQFNLTTRRYNEHQVAELETDPRWFTLQVRLSDVFGDNGMISVVICEKRAGAWSIDTWLMSCRVLGRRVEEAVLHEIARCARASGASELIGTYLPTGRNQLVRDHYPKLGFSLCETRDDASTVWRLALDGLVPSSLPFVIERRAL